MHTTKQQTPTENTGAYTGGIIEAFTSWIGILKDVKQSNLARLIPKIKHHNIRNQPMKHISTIP